MGEPAQIDFFGLLRTLFEPELKAKSKTTQEKEIERVSSRIAESILSFARARLQMKRPEFFAEELRTWIRQSVGEVAPDSPGRILRQLRQQKRLAYEVVNRAESKYRLSEVRHG